ncbi:MAG: exopolysaccharide biosynthesis protein, partial [Chlamydiota bacterium]
SIPFAIIIAFLGLRMAFSKTVWLPKSLLGKTVPSLTLKKITEKTLKVLTKIHKWTHPRLNWLCQYRCIKVINGLLLAILAIFLALPAAVLLPNLTAAWSILLISWGSLEDDGVFLLIGYGLFVLTITFFILTALTIRHVF